MPDPEQYSGSPAARDQLFIRRYLPLHGTPTKPELVTPPSVITIR